MRHARVVTAVAIFMFASSSLADAQTSATASSTRDDTTRACSARAELGRIPRAFWMADLSALIRFWERERCRRPTLLIFEVE